MARLQLAIVPRAASDRVGPYQDGTLRVRVTRAPVDGEANRAVLRVVARALDLPLSRLTLVGGRRSRRKLVEVGELSDAELARRLAGLSD